MSRAEATADVVDATPGPWVPCVTHVLSWYAWRCGEDRPFAHGTAPTIAEAQAAADAAIATLAPQPVAPAEAAESHADLCIRCRARRAGSGSGRGVGGSRQVGDAEDCAVTKHHWEAADRDEAATAWRLYAEQQADEREK